jgi:ABC-type sugar transport system ATPase subunit
VTTDGHSALGLRGIGKRFPGVIALDGIDLDLGRGEVHALLGENGAGKSTLIKILTGIYAPDSGHIERDGEHVTIPSPKAAQRLGISLVPQDVLFVPGLSVGRNILLGLEGPGARPGGLSPKERETVGAALEKVGASFGPETPTRSLSVPHLRLAQIARALIQAGDIMVLDEPTAVLSEPDADHLLERLDSLRAEGRAILYVTHRLSEVMRLADRMTILRDGRRVGEYRRGEIGRDDIVRLMTKDTSGAVPFEHEEDGASRVRPTTSGAGLVVRGLTSEGRFDPIDLAATPGAIIGIAGVQGSGHGALLRCLGGLDPVTGGEVMLDGERVPSGSVGASVRRGLLTVPADRRGAAIVPPQSVRANIALSGRIRPEARRFGLRWHGRERTMAEQYVRDLSVRPADPEARIANLSGGNQQKVAIARVIESRARVLLIEEPTQGVDVHAKREIHALLRRFARQEGGTVIVATSEFEELIGLADEIHVLCSGRLVRTIPGREATYRAILESALA